MIKNSALRFSLVLLITIVSLTASQAQFVGIGTNSPDYKLHITGNTAAILKLENTSSLNTNIPTYLMFKTGTHFTGSIQTIGTSASTARLGLFTNAGTTSSALLERMSIANNGNVGIGITSPGFPLDVHGRIRVRHNGGTSGIWFMDDVNTSNRGFVGMENNNSIGLYGSGGASWGLTMDVNTGDVNIPAQLIVQNNSNDSDTRAISADATAVANQGIGVHAEGGLYGVYAKAEMPGTGDRAGVYATAANGAGTNVGVYATAEGGINNYGIYATAPFESGSWAGYFAGDVITIGAYQTSDRKLKSDIQPMHHALQLISALKPSTYSYRSAEYQQMALPRGHQYGLIADEVKQVFPDLVKKAVQPAKYENNDLQHGKKLTEEVEFEAVNYTGLIPVLIASIQEQQAMIQKLQQKVAELEAR